MANAASWLDEINATVDNEQPRAKGPSRGRRLPKSAADDTAWSLPLFLLAVLLTVGLIGAVVWKRNGASVPAVSANDFWRNQAPPTSPPPRYRDTVSQADFDQLRTTQEKIWERTKWNSDIITLMSIVDNHNLAVSQNGYPKSHYIYLNEDWTINRLPDYVQLDPETKAFLQKFVRK